MYYLDNAATTQPSKRVIDIMNKCLADDFGNPGGLYFAGRKAKEYVETARENVANVIGAGSKNIIFTSGGSESNNLALHGVKDYLRKIGRTHIIISSIEHDSVIKSSLALRDEGFTVEFVNPNRTGVVEVESVESLITPSTGLVSVMFVNNETGAVNDVNAIGELCSANGILFHTDCVQAAGVVDIDVEAIKCDMCSISSHKIHGPKGVGALYVRDKNIMKPIIYGGSEQEFGLRGGTENVPGIAGFGEACAQLSKTLGRKRDLKGRAFLFHKRLKEEAEFYGMDDRIRVSTGIPPTRKSRQKVLSLTIDGVDAEALVMYAAYEELDISGGSACRSNEMEPSRVLLAMGLTPEEARSTVRISFNGSETNKEIYNAAEILAGCIENLILMGRVTDKDPRVMK